MDENGYIDFALDKVVYNIQSTTDELAELQGDSSAERLDEEYVLPYLKQEAAVRVLDVGCGVGRTVARLVAAGYEAYGIDLPCLSPYWSKTGKDRGRFVCGEATNLPFADGCFDVVISMGVIEHIGTVDGHCTLADDYDSARRSYARELLRVAKPGGRILLACPNKRFPIDPQHLPSDAHSPRTLAFRLRDYIFNKTGLNIHRTWGKYHLLSYDEVRELFIVDGGGSTFEPLPLKGYFGLTMFKSGFWKPFAKLAEIWINDMPAFLRSSSLNPYVLAQIRKDA